MYVVWLTIFQRSLRKMAIELEQRKGVYPSDVQVDSRLRFSPNSRLTYKSGDIVFASQRGKAFNSLVFYDDRLRACFDPTVTYGMTSQHEAFFRERREMLCSKLGLPKDEAVRTRIIDRYKRRLIKRGLPFWNTKNRLPG